jgi:hypothetical protein
LQSDNKEQETIRHYLLGQATQEDSSSLEERLLRDSALFQALLIAEDELIDQYLSDKLTAPERQSVESHFLMAPERQRKLRFGRALHKYVDFAGMRDSQESSAGEDVSDEEPAVARAAAFAKRPKRRFFSFLPATNPTVAYALAAAILLIVGGVSLRTFNNWRQQTQPQTGLVYVAALTPGLTRDSGELKRLSIPPGPGTVQLKLLLRSDEDPAYRAEVLTSERASVWLIDGLKAQLDDPKASARGSERFIILSIPTSILKRDDYEVRVSSRHSDGSYQETDRYQFRVVE